MDITIGRTVLYTLTADDAVQINRRRTTGASIGARIQQQVSTPDRTEDDQQPLTVPQWPLGAQAHIGNESHEGDIVPMVVVRVWSPTCVNGQALLDGNDVLWTNSVTEGTGPRTWAWPPRA